MGAIMEAARASIEQGRSTTPFQETIAGIGSFFSSAVRELVESLECLEAGSEEGVRIVVETFREDERPEVKVRIETERVEAERRKDEDRQRQEEQRIEKERREQDQRNRDAKQKKRHEETAFWTTPGLRPLAEPPILDWDWFFRDHIPSDLRYQALFPDYPEKRCRIKDLHGEKAALQEYSHCMALGRDSLDPSKRRQFYGELMENLVADWKEVDKEFAETFYMAAPLAQFEFRRLDNDGKTTGLQAWVEKGADIFAGEPVAVRNKYRHLVPAHFVEDPLATFSYIHEDGATEAIKQQMEQGNDVLIGWPKEVQDRYGYLRRFLPDAASPSTPSSSTSARSRWQLPPTLIGGWAKPDAAHENRKMNGLDLPSVVTRLVRSRRNSLSPTGSSMHSIQPEE